VKRCWLGLCLGLLSCALHSGAPGPAIAQAGASAQEGATDPSSEARPDVPSRGSSEKIEKAEAAEQAAAPAASKPSDRWRFHIPSRRTRQLAREILHAPFADWNPANRPLLVAKEKLADWGFLIDLDTGFFEQYASQVSGDDHNAGTYTWQLVGDFEIKKWKLGDSYLEWTLFGSVGFDYDAGESLSRRVGSISIVNSTVYPNGIALDELYLKHVSPEGRFALLGGRVDMLQHFDTNRVANDGYRQFFALALENNLSIPAPDYGGFGGIGVWNITHDVYFMAGIGDSTSNEQAQPWKDIGDGSWWAIAELGITARIPGLGTGNLRINPWHNKLLDATGFGFGINFDQELFVPWVIAFFRFGFGDKSVTPVYINVSGGVSIDNPFGGKHQALGMGFSWADPSPGFGTRAETLFEIFYRWRLTRSIYASPDLQVILHPAANPDADLSLVGGVRLMIEF